MLRTKAYVAAATLVTNVPEVTTADVVAIGGTLANAVDEVAIAAAVDEAAMAVVASALLAAAPAVAFKHDASGPAWMTRGAP